MSCDEKTPDRLGRLDFGSLGYDADAVDELIMER